MTLTELKKTVIRYPKVRTGLRLIMQAYNGDLSLLEKFSPYTKISDQIIELLDVNTNSSQEAIEDAARVVLSINHSVYCWTNTYPFIGHVEELTASLKLSQNLPAYPAVCVTQNQKCAEAIDARESVSRYCLIADENDQLIPGDERRFKDGMSKKIHYCKKEKHIRYIKESMSDSDNHSIIDLSSELVFSPGVRDECYITTIYAEKIPIDLTLLLSLASMLKLVLKDFAQIIYNSNNDNHQETESRIYERIKKVQSPVISKSSFLASNITNNN